MFSFTKNFPLRRPSFTVALLLSLSLVACSGSEAVSKPINAPYMEYRAEMGDAEAMYILGSAYFNGAGIPKNNGKAYAWLSVAKSLGNAEAGKLVAKVENEMTPEQLIQGQNAAAAYFERYSIFFHRSPEAMNEQRTSDLNTIINAIYQYAIDRNGAFPADIPNDHPLEICPVWAKDCTGRVSLNTLLGTYLKSIPADPKTATESSTRYTIVQDAEHYLTASAPDAEGKAISITR